MKARPGGPHLDGLGDAQSLTSANVQRGEETIAARSVDQVSAAPDELADYSLDESDQRVPPASPIAPVTIEAPPASTPPERKASPLPSTSVTSLDNLQGIQPIAEALIKTLAGKARTGRLDELKALELLQQAILL
ncbi:hypothetical protein [Caballeronia pedi]|uniref:hypothetical protein n=1 Tax=Caballeronia pedi TaxID=1777141 RepID=UPI001177C0EF|nr:hypothetical protein [Caballeronia pedi]